MISFYAVRPKFYHTLTNHPDLLQDLYLLSEEQKTLILEAISPQDVRESALSFFEMPVYEDREELSLKMHGTRKSCVRVHDGIAQMDTVKNPFLELLKRKYPCHIVEVVK